MKKGIIACVLAALAVSALVAEGKADKTETAAVWPKEAVTVICPWAVGGVADHVHLLARFGRGLTQSDWVKELKRVSSRWVKERDRRLAGFAWQVGYGAFSVSPSALEAVESYIHGQGEHHRTVTFQD